MSVYYNINLKNENESSKLFQINDNAFTPILDKMDDYQVGIKRFKIPTDSIDFYRIYPEYSIMAVGVPTYNQVKDEMTYGQLCSRKQLYNNDFDPDENTHYQLVRSNDEYANILTRRYNALFKSNLIFRNLSQVAAAESNIGHREYSNTANLSGAALTRDFNDNNAIVGGEITRLVSGDVNSNNTGSSQNMSRRTFSWEVNVGAMSFPANSNQPAIGLRMGILVMGKYGQGTAEFSKFIPLWYNIGQGLTLAEMTAKFPNGFKISSYGDYPLIDNLDIRTDDTPHFYPSSNRDLDDILMTYGEYCIFKVVWYYGGDSADLPTFTASSEIKIQVSNDPIMVGSIDLRNTGAGAPASGVAYNQDVKDTIQVKFPRFRFDEDTQRLVYTATDYMARQVQIFVNPYLKNRLGFECNTLDPIFKTTGASNYNLDNNPSTYNNSGGGFLHFAQNPSLQSNDIFMNDYLEQQSSIFKRNLVFGIIITANNFAFNGEFLGSGDKKLNILSDFEIDPSTNFRDFYIFQPEGNSVRYYDMVSTAPLRDVFLSVYYLDMNNNIKPMRINQGTMGSVKLHFRPINQRVICEV